MFRKRLALTTAACALGAVLTACGGQDGQQDRATDATEASTPASSTTATSPAAGATDAVDTLSVALPSADGLGDAARFAEKLSKTEAVRGVVDEFDFSHWSDSEELSKLLAEAGSDGAPDAVVAPVQSAARAFNEGADIRLAAATYWQDLKLVGTPASPVNPDDPKQWAEPLAGASAVTALPEHSVPVLALRHILDRNGLESVTITHAADYEAAAAEVHEGAAAALLTYADRETDLNELFKLQDEWARTTGSLPRLPSLGLIVSADLAENHREVVRTLVRQAQQATAEDDTPVLPGRDVASELGRFYENVGQSSEEVLGTRTIDPEFFLSGRA